jgi:hypothetical protein
MVDRKTEQSQTKFFKINTNRKLLAFEDPWPFIPNKTQTTRVGHDPASISNKHPLPCSTLTTIQSVENVCLLFNGNSPTPAHTERIVNRVSESQGWHLLGGGNCHSVWDVSIPTLLHTFLPCATISLQILHLDNIQHSCRWKSLFPQDLTLLFVHI